MAHGHGQASTPVPATTRRLLTLLVAPFAVATVIGLVLLWPGEVDSDLGERLGQGQLIDGRALGTETGPCPGTVAADGVPCELTGVVVLEGPDEGEEVVVQAPLAAEPPGRGDGVVLSFAEDAPEGLRYQYADVQRRRPLLVLAVLFVGAVVLLGRLSGVRALVGTVVSLGVLVVFVLPAVVEGSSPLAVALVGSSLIALVALYLTHGVSARTTVAVLGTLASLVLVGALAAVFVEAAAFSGLGSEEASLLAAFDSDVDFRGLLLGGIVIGTLGVLDDVTVTQVAAVWELHDADPEAGRRRLYSAALRIGRDHIASTVNTLVLAYAGAALPLLLLFTQLDQGLGDVLNGEVVAVEVVRTLAGSVGLVASVPLTTALAAFVVTAGGGGGPRPGGGGRPRPGGREARFRQELEAGA